MTSILVVCTGNICRSPIAEGLLRDALTSRFGEAAPAVTSSGTMGLTGSGAMPESIEAAAERGTDIAGHVARRLSVAQIQQADLVVAMAREHREAVARRGAEAEAKAFTLKELTRILEHVPLAGPGGAPLSLRARVEAADADRRAGFPGNPRDEDIADPLGMPLESYRAVAWELDGWTDRLVDGLYGLLPEVAQA